MALSLHALRVQACGEGVLEPEAAEPAEEDAGGDVDEEENSITWICDRCEHADNSGLNLHMEACAELTEAHALATRKVCWL